jgi:hypothetical protein
MNLVEPRLLGTYFSAFPLGSFQPVLLSVKGLARKRALRESIRPWSTVSRSAIRS